LRRTSIARCNWPEGWLARKFLPNNWPTATESQRAAAIEHFGSKRLLIRFSQPDRAALIKEYDGRNRRGVGEQLMPLQKRQLNDPEISILPCYLATHRCAAGNASTDSGPPCAYA
jgi:hypothetical protein